ncbi:MAG: YggS family pyridoxal phosphate-dependent enzyme [Prevotellaceae bacterium]|jgi:pyridoxal phosphate enzyme (YggS family)|nr:YggS family pyridoxal phosphate-dependent enzyme [Prevotellaceae bacterium]
MNEIEKNIQEIRAKLPENIRLVCVSKFHSADSIMQAYNAGERDFGESRAQELCTKAQNLPSDIRWHFIGPLQSNKIKQIAPLIYLIQSIESEKMLSQINFCAEKIGRKISVLLEVHIAEEKQKHGFLKSEILDFFTQKKWQKFPFIEICGLMGIATYTTDNEKIMQEFHVIKTLFDELKTVFPNSNFNTLSIGMSDDFPLAIEQNSTMIRVGSRIFGSRN